MTNQNVTKTRCNEDVTEEAATKHSYPSQASEAIKTTSQLNESNYRAQQSFLKDYWWKRKPVLKHQSLPKATQVDNVLTG